MNWIAGTCIVISAIMVGAMALYVKSLGSFTDQLKVTHASNMAVTESNRHVTDANVIALVQQRAVLAEMKALHDLHERATLEAVRSMKSPLLGKELSA